LQCVAVCCSVLQRVAACCSVLQCVAVCCSVLQRVAACCSVLQCVAVCCSVLQCITFSDLNECVMSHTNAYVLVLIEWVLSHMEIERYIVSRVKGDVSPKIILRE